MSRAPKPLNPYSSWSSLFGATVRRLRLGMRAGRPLTQAELGKQIGYSDATVGAVERSTLRPDTAFMEGCERVCQQTGCCALLLPFVLAEWDVWEQTGQRPTTDPLPPAEILSDDCTCQVGGPHRGTGAKLGRRSGAGPTSRGV